MLVYFHGWRNRTVGINGEPVYFNEQGIADLKGRGKLFAALQQIEPALSLYEKPAAPVLDTEPEPVPEPPKKAPAKPKVAPKPAAPAPEPAPEPEPEPEPLDDAVAESKNLLEELKSSESEDPEPEPTQAPEPPKPAKKVAAKKKSAAKKKPAAKKKTKTLGKKAKGK